MCVWSVCGGGGWVGGLCGEGSTEGNKGLFLFHKNKQSSVCLEFAQVEVERDMR